MPSLRQYATTGSLVTLLVLRGLLEYGESAHAEFFQYTDSDGTVVFVDEADKVPNRYWKEAILRQASNAAESTSKSRNTRVTVTDNKVYVPVTVSYRGKTLKTWFLLDTGASVTIISATLAEKLGIQTADTTPGVTRVADGRSIQSLRTNLNFLSVDPKTVNNIDVGILQVSGPPLPFEGWLGMNFLAEFRHQLDVTSQTIKWIE